MGGFLRCHSPPGHCRAGRWLCPLSCHQRGVPGKQERRGSCSQLHAHRARTGLSLFGAWCQHSPSAMFYNQGNKQPCTLGRGARGLRGCLPWMNGHNPLNNERLLCLCLSFWQGCSLQVLLISALLATLRVSIAGWPSQLQFCLFSTSQGS